MLGTSANVVCNQGLDWCIKNDIDIVCMACGFYEDEDELLLRKVQEASRKMLIFAAPTNEGNAEEIAYPARYHGEVFCMFSSNGLVKKSVGLNPSKGLGLFDLAILGEHIKTYPGDKISSGTSFSTAIAAGFAARLLDFSRHKDVGTILGGKAEKLKKKRNMTGVFLSIAHGSYDRPYHCIKPWALLNERLLR